MKFFLASALFAAVLAAPAAPAQGDDVDIHENIFIEDFFVRRTGDNIVAADFKLTGDDVKAVQCEIGKVPKLPSTVVTCGDTPYRFSLIKGRDSDYGLTIYHQTGQASGKWGDGDVTTHCRAGGDGADDYICGQVQETAIVIRP